MFFDVPLLTTFNICLILYCTQSEQRCFDCYTTEKPKLPYLNNVCLWQSQMHFCALFTIKWEHHCNKVDSCFYNRWILLTSQSPNVTPAGAPASDIYFFNWNWYWANLSGSLINAWYRYRVIVWVTNAVTDTKSVVLVQELTVADRTGTENLSLQCLCRPTTSCNLHNVLESSIFYCYQVHLS